MKPTLNNVPHHIGIILDGNRRFAKRLMLKPWKGHEWGAKKLRHLFEWCKEYDIKELTLYAFSVENFDRPKNEFNYLMDLFRKEFDTVLADPKIHESNLRFHFIGRLWMFPKDIQERMQKIMDLTKSHTQYVVNFAMAYGGRAEVVDAAKKIAEQVKDNKLKIEDINEQVFSENLYMQDEPDLIIRTSESRLSGFLPWQSIYSEIIFLPDTLWPEFEKKDFVACINEFQKRQRRYGK